MLVQGRGTGGVARTGLSGGQQRASEGAYLDLKAVPSAQQRVFLVFALKKIDDQVDNASSVVEVAIQDIPNI